MDILSATFKEQQAHFSLSTRTFFWCTKALPSQFFFCYLSNHTCRESTERRTKPNCRRCGDRRCLFGFTFFCCEVACGIAPACSGGVVCGWGGAPRGEWGTREWREGQSSDPAWTAGQGADVLGWGCLPSARQRAKNVKIKTKSEKYVLKLH